MAAAPAMIAGDDDLVFEFLPFIRVYRSGRVERLFGNDRVPAGADAATGVTSKDVDITADVSARLYLPNVDSPGAGRLPVVVFFHGGGFVTESARSPMYHRFINSLAAAAAAVVVSVEYRLAPEHPLPAAYVDAHTALDWVHASSDPWLSEHGDPTRVFFAGDSAGANIVHNMTMSGHKARGIILLHPWFWGVDAIGNETTDAAARRRGGELWDYICPGAVDSVDDPRVNPMSATAPGLGGLACEKVMVCFAAEDMLVDRGRAYAEAVRRCGVLAGGVEAVETEGEVHVFFLFKPNSEKAKELLARIVRFINDQ